MTGRNEVQSYRNAVIPFLQLALPILTAGALFFYRGAAKDLNNPDLPSAFRLIKDVLFVVVVSVPFVWATLTRTVVVPPRVFVLLLTPAMLALLMMVIGALKTPGNFASPGQLRNLGLYYSASGAIALLAWWYNDTQRVFRIFRVLMAGSVLLGIFFYVWADNILLYTITGRMIGTLANPNFLGFLCFLWLVVIHAEIAKAGSTNRMVKLELGLALAGLLAAASIAAIASYAIWAVIVAVLFGLQVLPGSRAVRRILVLQGVLGGILLAIGTAVVALASDAFQLLLRVQSVSSGQSETTSVRLTDLFKTYTAFAEPGTILLGQWTLPYYVQFDGSNQSILYNFGLPVFLIWTAFVLAPVFFAAREWKRWTHTRDETDWLAMLLTPFIVVSFLVEFWIQFVPEMYPTCVLFGLVLYVVALHACVRPSRLGERVVPLSIFANNSFPTPDR